LFPAGRALYAAETAIKTADPIVTPAPEADRVASTAATASQACRPAAAAQTRARGGIEDAAAPAVTFKSRGLPVYAGQMPPTVRIQRASG
jgi:hypothetical protein